MISSAAMPATGEPRMTRGVSPQASVVMSPTASSRSQIAGTSSMRIQCSWMFCRSVMSAVLRPKSWLIPAIARSWSPERAPPSERIRSMKYSSSSSLGSRVAVLPPSMPGTPLRVEAPPAHPAAQVVTGDGGEAVRGVVVDDPLAHVETVVGLLELLVVVQRRTVAVGPRTGRLARLPGRARRRRTAGAGGRDGGSGHPSSVLPRRSGWHNCPLYEPTAVLMHQARTQRAVGRAYSHRRRVPSSVR